MQLLVLVQDVGRTDSVPTDSPSRLAGCDGRDRSAPSMSFLYEHPTSRVMTFGITAYPLIFPVS
jgi:hypothetical protein